MINSRNKKISKLPKIIFFDLDNTLYNYNVADLSGKKYLCNKFKKKLNIDENKFNELYEQAKENVKINNNRTAASHSRLLYIQNIFEILGLGSQLSLMIELEQSYWNAYFQNMSLYNGVVDLLEELRLKEVKCSIITDLTSQIQFRKLIYLGIENYFSNITTSEELLEDKPNPNIFLKALKKDNISKESDIWIVGDSIEKDLIGAKIAVSAITFLKESETTRIENGKEKNIDFIFNEFNDLRSFINNIDE